MLLHGQGIAVFRRDHARVYAALDYGQSGGGHGHPDRLNVLFSVGPTRWLDDLGTGSYVDPSLHWYRSTLAHNAPFVDGHSQWRVDGVLEAFDEQEQMGWVRAQARIWPDVVAQRTLVAMPEILHRPAALARRPSARVALPVHCDAELSGPLKPARGKFAGAGGLEDGDRFVTTEQARAAAAGARVVLSAEGEHGGDPVRGFIRAPTPTVWYTMSGPGQPPGTRRRFHVVESAAAPVGAVCTVWTWSRDVEAVEWSGETIVVSLRDGSRHRHEPVDEGWHMEIVARGASRYVDLGGLAASDEPPTLLARRMGTPVSVAALAPEHETTVDPPSDGYNGLVLAPAKALAAWWADAAPADRAHYAAYHLGAPTYRRSEETWAEAGGPTARVAVAAASRLLVVDVQVATANPRFVPADAVNPYDNESPDINGDGVQLYVRASDTGGAWVLVPETTGKAGVVRARPVEGWGSLRLARTAWRRTREGYELRAEVALPGPLRVGSDLALDVLVNETGLGRERRRGQLMLSGPDGEFVYLRGDRHDPSRLIRFTIVT